jgi:hypothetical protein
MVAVLTGAVGITMVCASMAFSQFARGPRYATISATAKPVSVSPGGHGDLVIHILVEPAFHINSAHPKDPDLIATVFTPASSRQVTYGSPIYPKDQSVTTSTGTLMAYTGNVDVTVPFSVKHSAKAGTAIVGGSLTYQGCNANACYPPKQDKIAASVEVK